VVKRNLWSEDDIINHHTNKDSNVMSIAQQEEKDDVLAKLEREAKVGNIKRIMTYALANINLQEKVKK